MKAKLGMPEKVSEAHKRAYKEYVDGATMAELAKKYGVTVPAVSKAFKRAGFTARPRGPAARLGTPQHPNNKPLAVPPGSEDARAMPNDLHDV